MREYIPQWIYDRVWPGRSRECPKCGTAFFSKFDKGHCPRCYHSFPASDVVGLPPGITLAQALEYTPEESSRVIATLAGRLMKVDVLTVPIAREGLPELDRKDWEFHRRWLIEEMDKGGTLYAWSTEEPMANFGGYIVVKNGRVMAMMRTQVLLGD